MYTCIEKTNTELTPMNKMMKGYTFFSRKSVLVMCSWSALFSFANHTFIICALKKNKVSDKIMYENLKTNHMVNGFTFN